jgi:hypothetical protein
MRQKRADTRKGGGRGKRPDHLALWLRPVMPVRKKTNHRAYDEYDGNHNKRDFAESRAQAGKVDKIECRSASGEEQHSQCDQENIQ